VTVMPHGRRSKITLPADCKSSSLIVPCRLLCTRGTVSDCGDDDLNDGDEVTACAFQYCEGHFPAEADGEGSFDSMLGEYSFVMNQPGSG
jgi:hypothetical protein